MPEIRECQWGGPSFRSPPLGSDGDESGQVSASGLCDERMTDALSSVAVRTSTLAVSTYAIRGGHAESCNHDLKHLSQAFLRREET